MARAKSQKALITLEELGEEMRPYARRNHPIYSGYRKDINWADPTRLGVQLGLVCVKYKVAIERAADVLGVNKYIVLEWMRGRVGLSKEKMIDVQNLIDLIRSGRLEELEEEVESDE